LFDRPSVSDADADAAAAAAAHVLITLIVIGRRQLLRPIDSAFEIITRDLRLVVLLQTYSVAITAIQAHSSFPIPGSVTNMV